MTFIPVFPQGADFDLQRLRKLADAINPTDAPTLQQVTNLIAAAVDDKVQIIGGYDAATNTPNLTTPTPGTILVGHKYFVTVAGTFHGEQLEVGDSITALSDDPGAGDWLVLQTNIETSDDITEGVTNLFITSAEKAQLHDQNTDTKLDEGGANEVSALEIRTHIDDADKHRLINDAGTAVIDLWSADKISTELDGKLDKEMPGYTIIVRDSATTGDGAAKKISQVSAEVLNGVVDGNWFLVEQGGVLKKAKRQQFLPEMRGAVSFTRLDTTNALATTLGSNLVPAPILATTYVANAGAGIINATQNLAANRYIITDQTPTAAKTWIMLTGSLSFKKVGGSKSTYAVRVAVNGSLLNYPRVPFTIVTNDDPVAVPGINYTFGSENGRTFELYIERLTGNADPILVGSNVGIQSFVSR
jgi:hypothetical protein